jgi:hypothetical protein
VHKELPHRVLKDLRVTRQKVLKVISELHHKELKGHKVPKVSKEDLVQQDQHSLVTEVTKAL